MAGRIGLVAIVPMRAGSERVPGKNHRMLGDRPLYAHVIESLLAVEAVERVVVDTDCPVVKAGCARRHPEVLILDRPPHLAVGTASMNDVLLHGTSQVPAALYLQTHATNPLLRPETIRRAIETFRADGGRHDSLFGVTRVQRRFWTEDGRPLNHDPARLERTQDLAPLFEENSCIYLFSPEVLAARNNRIGARPLLFEIPPLEALDIDEESDFLLVEALWRNRMATGTSSTATGTSSTATGTSPTATGTSPTATGTSLTSTGKGPA